jgi:hypothetical protein
MGKENGNLILRCGDSSVPCQAITYWKAHLSSIYGAMYAYSRCLVLEAGHPLSDVTVDHR